MRKRRDNEEPSMDAMMDTLTNVVGILIFVLMITMLSVNDAVKQILRAEAGFEKKEITPEQLQKIEARAAELAAAVKTLSDQEPRIRTAVAQARIEAQGLSATLDAEPVDPATLRAEIQKKESEAERLEAQAAEAIAKARQVQALLAQTPELEEEPPKIVRLPDPRSPPEGAQPELFLCRGGRVIPVNVPALQKLTLTLAQKFAQPTKDGQIDCEQLVQAFENRTVGDEHFRIRIQIRNGHPIAILERKPEAGDTLEEMERPGSDFQRRLRLLNSKKEYCRFLVWPDSFEVYIRARELADERKMMAGWQPVVYDPEWPLYIPGLSHLRCKGVPPPPPPQPGAPPPQGPPKPADVID